MRDHYGGPLPEEPSSPRVPTPAFTAARGDRTLTCDLVRHAFGLDLRLWERGEVLRSRLAKSSDELMSPYEQWIDALEAAG
jgi:hypothetical protein